MIGKPEDWLIATAAFPIMGSIGALVAILIDRRRWGLVVARIGLAGGFACGAALAMMLSGGSDSIPPEIRVSLWTWLSFARPHSPSLVFGLEATWIKASLMSLTGALALLALWNADSRKNKPLSNDVVLTTSLLDAAGTVFVFAPNLSQAFLGWGAVSVLAGILIRLSRQPFETTLPGTDAGSLGSRTRSPREIGDARWNRRLKVIADSAAFLERIFVDPVWRAVKKQLPNWLGEQVEVIENSSTSFQLLATILGASAILLTWLLIG